MIPKQTLAAPNQPLTCLPLAILHPTEGRVAVQPTRLSGLNLRSLMERINPLIGRAASRGHQRPSTEGWGPSEARTLPVEMEMEMVMARPGGCPGTIRSCLGLRMHRTAVQTPSISSADDPRPTCGPLPPSTPPPRRGQPGQTPWTPTPSCWRPASRGLMHHPYLEQGVERARLRSPTPGIETLWRPPFWSPPRGGSWRRP